MNQLTLMAKLLFKKIVSSHMGTTIVIVSFCTTMPLYAGEKKPLKAGKVEQKIFKIMGDNAWLDTGFVLTLLTG